MALVKAEAFANLAYHREEVREIVEKEKDDPTRKRYLKSFASNTRLQANALDEIKMLAIENKADEVCEELASNTSIGEDLTLELAEAKSVITLLNLLANHAQSARVLRNVLDNNLFRERMLELDFSLPENITAAFLNPQMDVDLAVSFSLMLRGTEYEPLDVAFILREDAVARGADHWAVKNFFSVSAQRIYELIHLMRQEEREIADLIF